jgi:hypothetical protein
MTARIGSPDGADSTAFRCKLCEALEGGTYLDGSGARLRANRVCHSCDWWFTCGVYRMIGDRDYAGRRVVRAGGRHYLTWTTEKDRPKAIGEGSTGPGELRYVLLDDPTSTVIESGSYWMMGSIPADLRDVLPDNARLVEPAAHRDAR